MYKYYYYYIYKLINVIQIIKNKPFVKYISRDLRKCFHYYLLYKYILVIIKIINMKGDRLGDRYRYCFKKRGNLYSAVNNV